jgi:hypothetical protein
VGHLHQIDSYLHLTEDREPTSALAAAPLRVPKSAGGPLSPSSAAGGERLVPLSPTFSRRWPTLPLELGVPASVSVEKWSEMPARSTGARAEAGEGGAEAGGVDAADESVVTGGHRPSACRHCSEGGPLLRRRREAWCRQSMGGQRWRSSRTRGLRRLLLRPRLPPPPDLAPPVAVGNEVELGGGGRNPARNSFPSPTTTLSLPSRRISSSGEMPPSRASGFAHASVAPDARWDQPEAQHTPGPRCI